MSSIMGSKPVLAATIVLVFVASYTAKAFLDDASRGAIRLPAAPQRIVSLAPSITETLFALGLGDRVVAVTRYCDYPPEALEKPRVGGLFHPNFEAIVGMHPELVITTSESVRPTLAKLGLATLVVRHTSVEGILESIAATGRACGAEEKAHPIVADVETRLATIQRKTAGLPRPRVLVAVDRSLDRRQLEGVYIAANDGHLDRIVELAGGRNAYRQGPSRFPVVSAEGLLKINPDVIVDLSARLDKGAKIDRRAMLADWQQLDEVEAVRRRRVYLVDDDFATVPGPRFILLVEKLARMIHPEVDWSGE